jgi:hypothetical protein
VARRIDIELTSARADGSWTWRAAGAREPKGVLDGSLLYPGAKPGDVLKAEADFELEGITIVSVTAPKRDTRPEPERIEVVGPSRADVPGVTTQLVGRSERRPGDHRRERDEGRPNRRERTPGRPQGPRETGRPRRPVTERSDAPEPPGERTSSKPTPARESTPDRGRNRGRAPSPAERPPADAGRQRPAATRFNPGNTYRRAVLESLPPEQQPIAEQVLRGGIPAVRTALHLEREKAAAEGRPTPNMDQLVAMAEQLLPKLKAAEWRDRAEAAAAKLDSISLRDLRSVVAGADVARDDETRALSSSLREALEGRIAKLRDEWSADIAKQLDGNHLVRALRLSARPPEPGARLAAELSDRLSDAAGRAMSPDTPAERWMALLDATATSPVRRSVRPLGLPAEAPPELKRSAHQHSGSIPGLATLLGVSIPPPPLPMTPRRKVAPRRASPDRRPPAAGVPPPGTEAAALAEGAMVEQTEAEAPVPEAAPPGAEASATPETEIEAPSEFAEGAMAEPHHTEPVQTVPDTVADPNL